MLAYCASQLVLSRLSGSYGRAPGGIAHDIACICVSWDSDQFSVWTDSPRFRARLKHMNEELEKTTENRGMKNFWCLGCRKL
jgi:hypothetical protein